MRRQPNNPYFMPGQTRTYFVRVNKARVELDALASAMSSTNQKKMNKNNPVRMRILRAKLDELIPLIEYECRFVAREIGERFGPEPRFGPDPRTAAPPPNYNYRAA